MGVTQYTLNRELHAVEYFSGKNVSDVLRAIADFVDIDKVYVDSVSIATLVDPEAPVEDPLVYEGRVLYLA
jgi:hypothetical protein